MKRDKEKCTHCGYIGQVIVRTTQGPFCSRYCTGQFYMSIKRAITFHTPQWEGRRHAKTADD